MLTPFQNYPTMNAFLLCYDVSDVKSYRRCFTEYAPDIARHAPDAVVVLCGLKNDLRMQEPAAGQLPVRCVPLDEAKGVRNP